MRTRGPNPTRGCAPGPPGPWLVLGERFGIAPSYGPRCGSRCTRCTRRPTRAGPPSVSTEYLVIELVFDDVVGSADLFASGDTSIRGSIEPSARLAAFVGGSVPGVCALAIEAAPTASPVRHRVLSREPDPGEWVQSRLR